MPCLGDVPGPEGVPGLGGAYSGGVPGPGVCAWSGGVCVETPQWLLLQAVRILLECILFTDSLSLPMAY